MKKTWTPGKIVAAVFGGIGACVVLIVSLYASLRPLSASIKLMDRFLYGSQEERNEMAELLTEVPEEDPSDEVMPDEETVDEKTTDDDRSTKKKNTGKDQYYELYRDSEVLVLLDVWYDPNMILIA